MNAQTPLKNVSIDPMCALSDETAVIGVGVVMLACGRCDGMIATERVPIGKAARLLGSTNAYEGKARHMLLGVDRDD